MSARLPRLRVSLAARDARGATGRPDRRVAEVVTRIATVLVALFALVVAAALAPEAAGSPPAASHVVVVPTP